MSPLGSRKKSRLLLLFYSITHQHQQQSMIIGVPIVVATLIVAKAAHITIENFNKKEEEENTRAEKYTSEEKRNEEESKKITDNLVFLKREKEQLVKNQASLAHTVSIEEDRISKIESEITVLSNKRQQLLHERFKLQAEYLHENGEVSMPKNIKDKYHANNKMQRGLSKLIDKLHNEIRKHKLKELTSFAKCVQQKTKLYPSELYIDLVDINNILKESTDVVAVFEAIYKAFEEQYMILQPRHIKKEVVTTEINRHFNTMAVDFSNLTNIPGAREKESGTILLLQKCIKAIQAYLVNTFAFQVYISPEGQQGIVIDERFCLNIALTLIQNYISKIAIVETHQLYEISFKKLCKNNQEILDLQRVKRIQSEETFFLRKKWDKAVHYFKNYTPETYDAKKMLNLMEVEFIPNYRDREYFMNNMIQFLEQYETSHYIWDYMQRCYQHICSFGILSKDDKNIIYAEHVKTYYHIVKTIKTTILPWITAYFSAMELKGKPLTWSEEVISKKEYINYYLFHNIEDIVTQTLLYNLIVTMKETYELIYERTIRNLDRELTKDKEDKLNALIVATNTYCTDSQLKLEYKKEQCYINSMPASEYMIETSITNQDSEAIKMYMQLLAKLVYENKTTLDQMTLWSNIVWSNVNEMIVAIATSIAASKIISLV